MKRIQLNIKVSEKFLSELKAVSEAAQIPYTYIVREAIDEKLEKLKSEPRIAKRLSNLTNEQLAKHAARVETV